MFKVTQSPRFWSTVEIEMARAEGGKAAVWPFDVEFPRLNRNEMEAFNAYIRDSGGDISNDRHIARLLLTGDWKVKIAPKPTDGEPVEEVKPAAMCKWRGVVDDQEQALEPGRDTINMLLNVVGVDSQLCKKFFAEMGRAASKN